MSESSEEIINDELLGKLKENKYLKKLCKAMFEAGYNMKRIEELERPLKKWICFN